MLSHDLREPINAINNFSELLESDHAPLLSPAGRQYLDFVRQGGARMATLLDDLLRFMQLGKRPVAQDPVDLNDVISRVVHDLTALQQTSGGRVESSGLPTVSGEFGLLQDLLHQLVKNGLQYARPGVAPQVRITAARENGFDLIHVDDNGSGIAPEHQEAVFGMLNRLHLRRLHPGSGLGLSIARRIAVLHGGSIVLASEPGQGSRFTLRLPTIDSTSAESFK